LPLSAVSGIQSPDRQNGFSQLHFDELKDQKSFVKKLGSV